MKGLTHFDHGAGLLLILWLYPVLPLYSPKFATFGGSSTNLGYITLGPGYPNPKFFFAGYTHKSTVGVRVYPDRGFTSLTPKIELFMYLKSNVW